MQRKRSCMRAQKIEDSSDARKRKTRSGEDAECVGKLRKENRSSAECRFRRSRTNEWSGRRVERVESGTRQTCLAITEKLKRWRQPLRFRGFFRNSVSRVSRLPRTASVLALPASRISVFFLPISPICYSRQPRTFPRPFFLRRPL